MKLKRKVKITFLIIIFLIVFVIFMKDNNQNDLENTLDNTPSKVEDKSRRAKLTLVGDFLFEEPFYNAIKEGDDKDKYFQNVKTYFQDDDLSIGNMEVVIGNDNLEVSGTGFNFCAPEYIGDLVNTLDLEVLGTANNHAYDRGLDGVKSTLNFFKNKTDILTVGTNISDNDISKQTLEINGIKFGFLAYTYGTNITPQDSDINSISYFKDPRTKTITKEYAERLENEITTLRGNVDVLIVLMHWGIEFTHTPNSEQKDMAKKLNELGVDIIVGSHSHSIEPIEWIGDEHKTLVYYSLGNFVSADDDVSRAQEDFDNAYQVGLLSQLIINKKDNNIEIKNISTEPIINFYDNNMRNFELVPLKNYNETYETKHYRYKYNFTKDFIVNMYNEVIAEEFR